MGRKRKTTKQFIEEARKVHGNKYDYSKTEYVNNHTKVCIICPKHGEFWITPNNHLSQKQGCAICSADKKKISLTLSKDEFIKRSNEVHGGKYDYSKVMYVNNRTKVCIICPKHGKFWQRPEHHMNGRGCQKCQYEAFSNDRRDTFEDFIMKVKSVHGDKYDYSKVNYIDSQTKVCIICPEHGEFWQIPASHMAGKGCKKCGRMKANESESLTTEQFIERARDRHGDKYDYSKTVYKGCSKKVCIICPIHGEFWQRAQDHYVKGSGCPECKKETIRKIKTMTFDEFIKRAKEVHGNKYDYSKTVYEKSDEKVTVICPTHGEFKVAPTKHMTGVGCPICRESKLEMKVNNVLTSNNINFLRQYRFNELGKLSLDFYLSDYSIAIECQGEQHYRPIKHFGGEEKFKKTLERDTRKKRICEEHGIKLLYFADTEFSDYAITDENNLIKAIIGNG